MSLLTTLDSTFWLAGPVLDPATPFLHHIPVLKSLAARINTLWTQYQSQSHRSNDDQAQQANDYPKTQELLAMSMILALRFSRVVLLQLPTHPRYQNRVHAAVLRPLVQEASKFLVQVEQYKADEDLSLLAPQVAESTEVPCESDRYNNRTELSVSVVVSSDLVPETTVENSGAKDTHRSDVTNIETNSQLHQLSLPKPSPSLVNPGGATAQLNVATQIGTIPHPVSPAPMETNESPSAEDTPSPPLSKSIDDQATKRDTLQMLVSLASLSTLGGRQGGPSASQSDKDLSFPRRLSAVSDTHEPRTTLEALRSSPIISPTATRPSCLRSAVERQSSIRRGLEDDPYLITSSTAKLESAIREANRLIERGRRRSGSTTPCITSPSPSSNQPLFNSLPILSSSLRPQISPAELDADDMARKIADAEYMSAMRVEWDIAREIADRTGVFPKTKITTSLSSSVKQEPRVAIEPVNDMIVRRSYSAAAAESSELPFAPKKAISRTARTTIECKPKVSFAESASAYSVRSRTSLSASTASAATRSLSSPSSPHVPSFGASLSASSLPLLSSSSPKASSHFEASLATPAKAPRIHRLCMEPVLETPSLKKSPREQGTTGRMASSSASTIESARTRARQGSVSSLISTFEKKCASSETSKDLPRRSYSASTLPLRPRPVSNYASLGSMPTPSTVVAPRTITVLAPVSAMARPLPTPPVRTPRVDSQKRHSPYQGEFQTLYKTRSVPAPILTPSLDNDTDSVLSDIYDDGDETVDLIRVATQSSVASSSTYLSLRSTSVPSAMETPGDGGLDKVEDDADASEESEGPLQFLDVPDPLDLDEWIKNRTMTPLSHELSTSSSVKSKLETSEQHEEVEGSDDGDDDDEPLGNHPSRRARSMPSRRSTSGSTSSVTGDLDDDVVALAPPSPSFIAPFTMAQSRSPVRMDSPIQDSSYRWRTPGSGSMDRAPSGRGFLKLKSNMSLASTSTRSLQRFEQGEDEAGEEKRSSPDASLSPSHTHMSRLDSIRTRNASGTVRSSSLESMNVRDAKVYLQRYRQ